MAYGSIAEVVALTSRYAGASKDFSGANDRPTQAEVTAFLNRVSALLDVMLAQLGYAVPVTNATAKLMLDEFTVEQVVQLVYAANGAGTFAPGSEQLRGHTAFQIITKEAKTFLEVWGNGLEAVGAERPYGYTYGLAATITDDDDDTLQPPFDFDPDTEPIFGALVDGDE